MTTKAPCRYCGQINIVKVNEEIAEEELIEVGTLTCSCELALNYQTLIERKEQALINLSYLFNNQNDEGVIQIPESVYEMCKQSIALICSGAIHKINLSMKELGKISISNVSGKIKIEHSKTNTKQFVS